MFALRDETKLLETKEQFERTQSDLAALRKQIEKEMEDSISEDAMDTYIGEFMRARTGFEHDTADIQTMMDHEKEKGLEDMDKELYLKLARFRHEIKLDSFKMLQDSALPLQVKKLKMEREKLRPTKPIPEVIKSEGVSE